MNMRRLIVTFVCTAAFTAPTFAAATYQGGRINDIIPLHALVLGPWLRGDPAQVPVTVYTPAGIDARATARSIRSIRTRDNQTSRAKS